MNAGLALAPDTFQIVLDSENEAKGTNCCHSRSPACFRSAAVLSLMPSGADPQPGTEDHAVPA